jgi:hypothetical protein
MLSSCRPGSTWPVAERCGDRYGSRSLPFRRRVRSLTGSGHRQPAAAAERAFSGIDAVQWNQRRRARRGSAPRRGWRGGPGTSAADHQHTVRLAEERLRRWPTSGAYGLGRMGLVTWGVLRTSPCRPSRIGQPWPKTAAASRLIGRQHRVASECRRGTAREPSDCTADRGPEQIPAVDRRTVCRTSHPRLHRRFWASVPPSTHPCTQHEVRISSPLSGPAAPASP